MKKYRLLITKSEDGKKQTVTFIDAKNDTPLECYLKKKAEFWRKESDSFWRKFGDTVVFYGNIEADLPKEFPLECNMIIEF